MPSLARALRRVSARLTEPVDVLDAAELAGQVRETGSSRVIDTTRGDYATLTGRIRTVTLGGGREHLGITAEVFDGTGGIEICWLGRRNLAGIDTGRNIRVTGRIGERDGRKIMFNPRYELIAGQPRPNPEEHHE